MVQEAYPQGLSGGVEAPGHLPVLRAWVDVAAGMVVRHDDSRRPVHDGVGVDLPRMHQSQCRLVVHYPSQPNRERIGLERKE